MGLEVFGEDWLLSLFGLCDCFEVVVCLVLVWFFVVLFDWCVNGECLFFVEWCCSVIGLLIW